jgi:hypothetical protein
MHIVDPPASDPPESAPPGDPPVRAISADALVATFEENGLAAERAFTGCLLVVSGDVASVHRGRSGGPVVSIAASAFLGAVECSFPESAFDELAELRRGQRIVVVGEFAGERMLRVRLQGCGIVRELPPGGGAVAGRAA